MRTSAPVRVTVSLPDGLQYAHAKAPFCVFDLVRSPAVETSPGTFECNAARRTAAGASRVALYPDGESRLVVATPYEYLDPISIAGVSPPTIPEAGGVTVEIRGSGFAMSQQLRCQFYGEIAVDAVWISRQAVACVAPVGPPGRASVQVSNNGGDSWEGSGSVEYLPALTITSASPAVLPASIGGTVNVTGTGFMGGRGLLCRVGSFETSAIPVDSHTIQCPILGSFRAGSATAPLELRYAEVRTAEWVSADDVTISFAEVPAGLLVEPNAIDSGAQTELVFSLPPDYRGAYPVSINGDSFLCMDAASRNCDASALSWRLMVRPQDSPEDESTGPCNATTSTLSCAISVPTVYMGSGAVDLLLSPNNGSTFRATRADLQVVHPSSVLATSPGVLSEPTPGHQPSIKVYTTAAVAASARMRCVFGSGGEATTPARAIDARTVQCAVPQLAPGTHPVHVGAVPNRMAARRLATRPTSAHVTILPVATVVGVSPKRVSSVSTTSVRVSGSGFVKSAAAQCRVYGVVSPATVLSANVMECKVPPVMQGIETADGLSPVEVSMDGVQFVSDPSVTVSARQEPLRIQLSSTSGPRHGGGTVEISALDGLGADASVVDLGLVVGASLDQISCDFNGTVVAGSVAPSSGKAVCTVPPSSKPGLVTVRLSIDGETYLRAAGTYTYVPSLAVLEARPSVLPETGAR